jgi:magnesium transporter
MRKIAAWAGIAAVWTAVAGVYGMNFKYMPELHWRYGYPVAFGFMVAVSVALYRAFRRSGWL